MTRNHPQRNSDPVQKLELLPAANKEPLYVSKNMSLKTAESKMMIHNFSQLPVMNSPTAVCGMISWETIGFAKSNGCTSDLVKDYMKKEFVLEHDTPLLDAVDEILKHDYALVRKYGKIVGIVTLADISEQFINGTAPFLLIEQIENHIRILLDEKFEVEELKNFVEEGTRDRIHGINDLTFGNYIKLIEHPENWDRLNLSVDRVVFVDQLNGIRMIRNNVMHFHPEGIQADQKADLIKMANFLARLNNYV